MLKTNPCRFLIYSFSILLICISTASSQSTEKYFYKISDNFIKNFSHNVYKGSAENWSAIQDRRGVMYFGNNKGILEFDGSTWRVINVPNTDATRTLSIDNNGIIYACAYANFGYLEPDSIGLLQFKTLLPYLDEKYAEFGDMWDVAASSKGIYYKSKDKAFRWDGNKITVWDSIYSFRLYNINDTVYARNEGVGLIYFDGDSVKIMPDGEFFKSIGVYDMLPFYTNGRLKILVTTNRSGLYLHDGKKFSRFKTEADSYLRKNQIYNACETADGNYAFATQRGGLVIINKNGHLIKIINESSGLPTDVVYDVYSVKQGGLWIATANGISYCEEPSPFSIIKDNGYLKNKVSSVIVFNGKLYAANDFGVLYLSEKNNTFQLAEGSSKPAYIFLDAEGMLVAATNYGVGVVEGNRLKAIINNRNTNAVIYSKKYPGRVYSADNGGFSVFQKTGNNLQLIFEYNSKLDFSNIVEEEDGNLWLNGITNNLLYVSGNLDEFSKGSDKGVNFQSINVENKRSGAIDDIFYIQGKLLFASEKGIFTIDKNSKTFLPDTTLGKILSDSTTSISFIKKGFNKDLWVLAKIKGALQLGKGLYQNNGKYRWQSFPEFHRLDLNSVNDIYSDYDEKSNTEKLWISTNEGLILYNPRMSRNNEWNYSTIIRKVTVNNDSLIFGGAEPTNADNKKIILPYSNKNIIFEYSSTSFDNPEETLYQYFLEGNDENWSKWISQTKKEYTNLSYGDYNFRVRSKNIYGIIGSEDQYAFKTLPPWYLTWQAYILYALTFIAGLFIIDRIQRRRVTAKERDKAKLREAELIRKQAGELETVDQLVRIINNAEDLETLFNSLVIQTVGFIPKAEKAAIFLLDHRDNLFHAAYALGYNIDDLESIVFLPEELNKRYTENSEEVEKGIYIINDTKNLYGDEKMKKFSKAKSMLIMAVEWDERLEAYVVYDSFADKNAFDASTARILNRFREHAVSAISKAQSLKILQEKNEEIIRTQEQLVTQQKLASLGTLTAGIAHEIKNPLNFVNNFAEISSEMIEELNESLENVKINLSEEKYLSIKEIVSLIEENLVRINSHGKRADSIVKAMLLHSRGSAGQKALTNINDLLEQYVNLAYHGLRAQDKEFNITIQKDYDNTIGKVNIVPQNISRVFLNIINNACYASNEKKRRLGAGFEPILKISTKNLSSKVEIRIEDNGNGIPESIKKNLFSPFFTTKPSGEGTGLGLSLSYDIIVKEHAGEIKFNSEEGEFTEFVIILPKNLEEE